MLTHSEWWVLMEPTLVETNILAPHLYWTFLKVGSRGNKVKVKCEASWRPFWHKRICFQTKKGSHDVLFTKCCDVIEVAIKHMDLVKVVIICKNI